MREFLKSEDGFFHLYEMEDELYVANVVPNYATQTVVIPDDELVAAIENMMAYAEERGLVHRKWKAAELPKDGT